MCQAGKAVSAVEGIIRFRNKLIRFAYTKLKENL